MRLFIILFILFISYLNLWAQELKCGVEVVTPKLQLNDPKVFEVLKTSVFEFMNNRKWTDDVFQEEEKIEVNLLINITEEISATRFRATFTIKSVRPVHNSSYNSVLFNHVDDEIEFSYEQYQPLTYNDNTFIDNLTATLAFYSYMVVGLDYESFSPGGGTPYFQKAQNIVNNAQNTSEPGWKAFEKSFNRYWIAENFNNSKYGDFNKIIYDYHRNGMDVMYKKSC